MGSYHCFFPARGKTDDSESSHMVHSGKRYLADGVDGAGQGTAHRASGNSPDIDKETLTVKTRTTGSKAAYVEAILKDGKKIVASGKAVAGSEILLSVKSPKLWDTHNPYLYDLEVVLYNNGKETDRIKSYAAMRKVSAQRDKDGFMRFQLNNKDIFHFGPLDQGWWPDGLYTPPSDEAMLYDVQKTKELGFNLIRKHIKVEPARWYTYCDRMGILVWQVCRVETPIQSGNLSCITVAKK